MMGTCLFIAAGIIGTYHEEWDANIRTSANTAGGWACVVFIWLFAVGFGFSWGPTAWVLTAETFPLGLRAKGVSVGASSNWYVSTISGGNPSSESFDPVLT